MPKNVMFRVTDSQVVFSGLYTAVECYVSDYRFSDIIFRIIECRRMLCSGLQILRYYFPDYKVSDTIRFCSILPGNITFSIMKCHI